MSDTETREHRSDEIELTAVEKERAQVKNDVRAVIGHLRENRTTESEAADLGEAARRSLADHAVARSRR
jgi:hypothetical protein